MRITSLSLISSVLLSLLSACGNGQKKAVPTPPVPPKTQACVDLDLTQILASYEVTRCDGTKAFGRVEACKEDGATGCVAVATFKAADMSLAIPGNMKSGVTIAGVSGSVTPSPANCFTAGEQACVATGTYFAGTTCGADASNCFLPTYSLATQPLKAISFNAIDPAKMLDSLTLSEVTGTVVSRGSWALTATFPGAGYYSGVSATPAASTIATSMTILGVEGSAVLTPANCSSDGATGCVVVGPSYAAAVTTGAASKILSGQSVAGVAGNVTLPAAGKVYTGITFGVSAGQTGTLTIPIAGHVLASSGTFGDPAVAVTPTLTIPTADNVRTSNGSFGVAGNGTTPTLADCSTNGATGCVTTSTYKSGDLTNLTEGNIKNGTTIAGVAGLYPNATYTLPSSGGAAGLTNATFDAKVKSATAFEYWTEAGAREQSVGDADITAANIASGVSIFGLSGSIAAAVAPNAWDVRVGTVVNGVTGKLKVNCRNRVRSALYNYDGAVGDIPNTPVITGTLIDYWDTIDDYNANATGLPTSVVTGWTNNDCGGKETGADDANVWKDVTTAGTGAATCVGSPEKCTMKDKITGLHWSKIQQSLPQNWSQAINICDVLSFNGQTDWRLPTQKELMEAYTHGIRSAASTNWITEAQIGAIAAYFWSGSSVSNVNDEAWFVHLAKGITLSDGKANTKQVVCVR